jgi:hypothetical protein
MLLQIVDCVEWSHISLAQVGGGLGALPACLREFCVAFRFFKSSSDLVYWLITSNGSLTEVG